MIAKWDRSVSRTLMKCHGNNISRAVPLYYIRFFFVLFFTFFPIVLLAFFVARKKWLNCCSTSKYVFARTFKAINKIFLFHYVWRMYYRYNVCQHLPWPSSPKVNKSIDTDMVIILFHFWIFQHILKMDNRFGYRRWQPSNFSKE